MKGSMYRWFHGSNALVVGTGLIYAWMRYFCEPTDPFSVVNHPLQPQFQHLHILTAPLLVLMVGVFWHAHAMWRWQSDTQEGRRSGLTAWVATVPMIASGYLIQTAVSPLWQTTWIAVHLTTSAIWIVGSIVHIITHRLRRSGN